jgi:hypothetical protein
VGPGFQEVVLLEILTGTLPRKPRLLGGDEEAGIKKNQN